ncbi:MAG TPA: hypothetical protein VK761_02275 [Solirubrobacteraceae bacterium]|jgi:hypothetical protein|nr:hypothetical protein [Solirubrobacteraceae bacterium]
MPTNRRRYQLTESEPVSKALALAAKRWPHDANRPSRLLQRLIDEGAGAIDAEREQMRERRREVIQRNRGAFAESYPAGYLEEERRGWPD